MEIGTYTAFSFEGEGRSSVKNRKRDKYILERLPGEKSMGPRQPFHWMKVRNGFTSRKRYTN